MFNSQHGQEKFNKSNLALLRSLSPRKAMANQRMVFLPGNTSLIKESRSEPTLNCRSHISVRESEHTHAPHVYAERLYRQGIHGL